MIHRSAIAIILIASMSLPVLAACDSSSPYDRYFFEVLVPQRLETFPDDTRIVQIATGVEHALALDENGEVWAWGTNDFGGLGAGKNVGDQYLPLNISQMENSPFNDVTIKQISLLGGTSLALDENGNVWAWGDDWSERKENSYRYLPENISGVSDIARIVQISTGGGFFLALDEEGDVWSWGGGRDGVLGTGDESRQMIPVNITTMIGSPFASVEIIQISAGRNHSLALDTDGNVWAWGYNWSGQLGTGESMAHEDRQTRRNIPNRYHPTNISNLPESELEEITIVQISAGWAHSLALDIDGNVWAWGEGNNGLLGTRGISRQYSPINISYIDDSALSEVDVVSVEAGRTESAAIDSSGNVWMWGVMWLESGDVLIGEHLPVNISAMQELVFYNTPIVQVSKDRMLLSSDGSVYAWGNAMRGRLGIGDISEWAIPLED